MPSWSKDDKCATCGAGPFSTHNKADRHARTSNHSFHPEDRQVTPKEPVKAQG